MRQYPAVLQYEPAAEVKFACCSDSLLLHVILPQLTATSQSFRSRSRAKDKTARAVIVAARARRTERSADPTTGQHVTAEELPWEHRRQAQFGAKGANACMFDQA